MEDFFENELAKRFEEMVENNDEFYFDSEELEEIIIHYLELGDITFAELAVNFGLKLHPNSLQIKIKKLEVLLELEDYLQIKELIDELMPSSMENIDFLICCAKYYSNLGNPKKSIEYCTKALEFREEENFLHTFIADEYVNIGDPFKALSEYKLALQADPRDDYALENIMKCYSDLKKSDEAISFLNQYLDEFPFSETAWYEYGQFYFSRKNYTEAIKGFDYLLAINSNSIGIYANKAACYEAMGKFTEAIAVYEEMVELEYTKAFTYYKIGLCFKATKKNMPALLAFQKALREDPQFFLAMMEQSYIYEDLGNKKEALHFAKEATYFNAGNLDYQKRLAFLYIDSGLFEESLKCLNTLVKQEPERFYNWYAYVEVLMLLEHYSTALEVLHLAMDKHQRAEIYYQMSNCCQQLGLEDKALKALKKALNLDKNMAKDMQIKYPALKDNLKKIQKKEN